MMLDNFYQSSFFIVAAVISLSTLIFNVVEGRTKKRQNLIFAFLLIVTFLSALTSVAAKYSMGLASENLIARRILFIAQYIYFLTHSLLPVLFYLYVGMVSGVLRTHSKRRIVLTMLPCIAAELLVVINPLFFFVYHYTEDYNFVRGWGEMMVYLVSAFYLILAMAHLLRYWQMLTFRRRWALLYSFGLAITGILLQLFIYDLRVELVFEAMAFTGIMLTVEKEDDRIDEATGIYNRTALRSDIQNYLRLETRLQLICVRVINSDVLQRIAGVASADAMIRDVAAYLKSVHSAFDIYRPQQAAFLLVLRDKSAAEVRQLAYDITRRFDEPWAGHYVDLRLKAVLLLAEVPEEYRTVEDVLLLCDGDLPAAETRRILSGSELRFLKRDLQVEEALLRGFTEHNFEMYYQPVYNLRNRAIHAAEAFPRLHDATLGVILPEEFMPIAVKNDIIERLNSLIIEEICLFLSSGIPTELGLMRILFGISSYQCLNPRFLEELKKSIRKYGVDASLINIELRDFNSEEDLPQLKQVFDAMKEMGLRLSLDRFGMGNSNLQSLSVLRFDTVNIDIDEMEGRGSDEIGYSLVENSVRMLGQMHKQILIKGISTQEEIDRISELDVDYLQGDYYSKAVSQNELISILRVTEVARREEQQARAQSEAKSSFLANMSHEIRTPINAILGMNEMILRESGDTNIIAYARDIERAGNTLLSLINDILDFSKIEAGRMEIILAEYGLSSVINDVVNLVQGKATQKGLAFILDVDERLPESLYGDEMRVRQIITNLLNNAVKYTETGSVTLSIQGKYLDDDTLMLRIDVADTGMGIKEEDVGKLFGTFQRVDMNRNRTIEGTGLGLAITQNLLRLMNGEIDVKSVYGEGSVFSVHLPQMVLDRRPIGDLKERVRQHTEERTAYHQSFTAPDAHILVVDDTPMNLTVIKGLLKKTELQIDTATGGEECLRMIGKTHYDCIFLDYRMPGMDGTETLHRMRAMRGHPNTSTPVIVLTANALTGAREKFLSEGFDDYLTKPVDTGKLEQMLIQYLPGDKVSRTETEESGTHTVESEARYSSLRAALPEIDIHTGIAHCGSEEAYEQAFRIYRDSLPAKAREIRTCFDNEDWENYTIQVHSLKSTSRVIGALKLGEDAWELEQAGDARDLACIAEKTPLLLRKLDELSEAFARLDTTEEKQMSEDASASETMDRDTWTEAWQALSDFVDQMDFEDSDFVLNELRGYAMSPEEAAQVSMAEGALAHLDWEELGTMCREALTMLTGEET